MAIRQEQLHEDYDKLISAHSPLRVVIAYDQLTSEEQGRVRATLQELDRKGPNTDADIQRLASSDPLYALNATPDITVIVRIEPGAPVEVMDIVRTETLRNFAKEIVLPCPDDPWPFTAASPMHSCDQRVGSRPTYKGARQPHPHHNC